MGSIIDLERADLNPRCSYVKRGIVFINIIASPISFIIVLFAILRMICIKKTISFITKIIIFIFSSEIINTISKMIQLIKYYYPDQRMDKEDPDLETPRGNICQIQISLAIFSDFCSLLLTLLLSLRCYDIINNKKKFFDQGCKSNCSLFLVVLISIAFSVGFIILDRRASKGNISYRYDVRDRCSYWCWLDHYVSLICFGFYWFILLLNIIFACRTYKILQKGYQKLLDESGPIRDESQNNSISPLNNNKDNNDNFKSESQSSENNYSNFSKDERKRMEELRIMKIKCKIYPLVTIIIWLIIGTYRVIDDSAMIKYDNAVNATEGRIAEQEDFENYPFFKICVQIFLVIHTLLSSLRGIIYGFCFIIFEEKAFFNIFKKCYKKKYLINDESEDNEESEKIVERHSSKMSNDNKFKGEKEDDDYKSSNIEMNSDYNYNESDKCST